MSDYLYENLLTHSIEIYKRSTSSTDKWGVPSESIGLSKTIKGLMQSYPTGDLEVEYRGKKYTVNYVCFISIDNKDDVDLDDIIKYDGIRYQVIHKDDAGGQGHHIELLLRRLEN